MWPFSTPKRVRADSDDLSLSNEELLLSLKRRVTALELQQEDLAAAYKRLRGSRAGEVRDTVPHAPMRPSEDPQDPREPGFDKEALRRKYLGRPRGNGQT